MRHLARRVLRQRLDEEQRAGGLDPGQAFAREGEERRRVEVRARSPHDDRCHPLSPLRVRRADRGGLLHVRVVVEGVLDFPGRHVLAAGDDDVLLAIDDVEQPVRVSPGDVPRQEPAVAVGALGRLGILEVAARHLVPAKGDLPGLTRCDVPSVVVQDPHFDERTRAPRRAQQLWLSVDAPSVVLRAQEAGIAPELGHAVPLTELASERCDRTSEDVRGNRGSAVSDGAQAARVRRRQSRRVEEHRDHRRRERHHRHPVPRDGGEQRLGVEAPHQDDRPPPQVDRQHVVARHVAERERVQVDVVRADRAIEHRDERPRRQVPVAQGDALGAPRRAAREDDPGERIVAVGREIRRRRARRRFEKRLVCRLVRRARVERHAGPERGYAAEPARDRIQQRALPDQHGRARRLELDRDVFGLEAVVEQDEGHAGAGHGVVGLDDRRVVLCQHRDPVARAGDLPQRVRQAIDPLVQRREGPRRLFEDQGRRVRRFACGVFEDRVESHGARSVGHAGGARRSAGRRPFGAEVESVESARADWRHRESASPARRRSAIERGALTRQHRVLSFRARRRRARTQCRATHDLRIARTREDAHEHA